MPYNYLIFALIFILIAGILAYTIRIVPQAEAYVIERLGAYNDTWTTGVHFVMPFIDRIANKVTLLEGGARMTRPENINGNWNANVGFMFNTAIDSAGYFNVNTFTNFGYNHNVGFVNDGVSDAKAVTKSQTIMERLAFSYRNDWLEIELNGSLNYNRNRSELQTSKVITLIPGSLLTEVWWA